MKKNSQQITKITKFTQFSIAFATNCARTIGIKKKTRKPKPNKKP